MQIEEQKAIQEKKMKEKPPKSKAEETTLYRSRSSDDFFGSFSISKIIP